MKKFAMFMTMLLATSLVAAPALASTSPAGKSRFSVRGGAAKAKAKAKGKVKGKAKGKQGHKRGTPKSGGKRRGR